MGVKRTKLEESYRKEINEAREVLDIVVGAEVNRLCNTWEHSKAEKIEKAWELVKQECIYNKWLFSEFD